jgi:DtxR family Mn-dependent transcriptional regulator
MELDVKLAHSVEHSLNDAFVDALCTKLDHPTECPHGHPIPPGDCCPPLE